MRIGAVALLALVVGACAGSGATGPSASVTASHPGLTGDQRGGKIAYGPGGLTGAMGAAAAHCKQFGKKAQITNMAPAPDSSGEFGFDCRGTL